MAAMKTSAQDAAALATRWYQQGLGRNPDPQGLAHWVSEIQKDGSNTAWQNFSNSPEPLKAGAAAKFAAAKINPIELTPGAGQLPGTAHGYLTDVVQRNESWLKPLAVTAATALGGPAAGAGVSGAWNYADTHNLGNAALDAAGTYGLGKLAGDLVPQSVRDRAQQAANALVNSSIGQGLQQAGQAIGNSPLGQAWDQTVKQPLQAAGQTVSGLPGVTIPGVTMRGGQPVSVGGLAGQVGNFLTGNNGLNALGTAAGLNAAYLGQKSANYAQNALDTQQALFNAKGGLRSAGIAGMQNPVTPTLPNVTAQRTAGNPFARPVPVTSIGAPNAPTV
jgi:hypothetical protein